MQLNGLRGLTNHLLSQVGGSFVVAQVDFAYFKKSPFGYVKRLLSYALFEGRPVTTRGQWVNPLVFAQLAMWKRLPQMRKVRKPVFILGTGRSGTTILGVLLSMHRNVGFLNEPKAMWHTIHPHEDVIGSYDRGEASYRLDVQDATPEVCRVAHKLFGGYLLSTLSSRVADKYPELIFRVPFVRAIFPDARFIFLVRDGWETCASIDSWSKRNAETSGGETHDWWGVNQRKWHLMLDQLVEPDPYFANALEAIRGFNRHLDMAATEWVVTMREGLRVKREHGAAVHLLKYEDLVNKPDATLGELLAFCELPEDKQFLHYAKATLRHAEPHAPYQLNPAILPLFRETLGELGYAA